MPFKSKAQRRWMFWAEAHGKLPKGTAEKWQEHTPQDEELPERVKEAQDTTMNTAADVKRFTPLKSSVPSAIPATSKPPRPKIPARNILKIAAELVPGGKGRDKPDSAFDKNQLRKAELIEKEHFTGSHMSPQNLRRATHEIGKDHLVEDPHYYDHQIFKDEIEREHKKEAGGPGSGVSGDNTLPIGLPLSQYVSVGTRKSLLDNSPYYEDEVPMAQITAVAQKNYVPDKLHKMQRDDGILNKPIDLLKVDDKTYHVIDGHHRFLIAKMKDKKSIRARVFTKRPHD